MWPLLLLMQVTRTELSITHGDQERQLGKFEPRLDGFVSWFDLSRHGVTTVFNKQTDQQD
jgi:hypothetical protein